MVGLLTLLEFTQACLEELDIGGYILVVSSRRAEGLTLMVEEYIEGLGVGTELHTLEVASLVPYRTKLDCLAVLLDFDRLLQWCLLVDHEGDQDVVIL